MVLFLFHLISFIAIDRALISDYQKKHLILSSAVSWTSVVPPRRRVLMIGACALRFLASFPSERK